MRHHHHHHHFRHRHIGSRRGSGKTSPLGCLCAYIVVVIVFGILSITQWNRVSEIEHLEDNYTNDTCMVTSSDVQIERRSRQECERYECDEFPGVPQRPPRSERDSLRGGEIRGDYDYDYDDYDDGCTSYCAEYRTVYYNVYQGQVGVTHSVGTGIACSDLDCTWADSESQERTFVDKFTVGSTYNCHVKNSDSSSVLMSETFNELKAGLPGERTLAMVFTGIFVLLLLIAVGATLVVLKCIQSIFGGSKSKSKPAFVAATPAPTPTPAQAQPPPASTSFGFNPATGQYSAAGPAAPQVPQQADMSSMMDNLYAGAMGVAPASAGPPGQWGPPPSYSQPQPGYAPSGPPQQGFGPPGQGMNNPSYAPSSAFGPGAEPPYNPSGM